MLDHIHMYLYGTPMMFPPPHAYPASRHMHGAYSPEGSRSCVVPPGLFFTRGNEMSKANRDYAKFLRQGKPASEARKRRRHAEKEFQRHLDRLAKILGPDEIAKLDRDALPGFFEPDGEK